MTGCAPHTGAWFLRCSVAARIALALIAAALIAASLLLCGCGRNRGELIQQNLESDFSAIRQGDTQKMQNYFGFDPSQGFSDLGISSQAFAAQFFNKLSITVDSVEIEDQNATANVTITSNDYATCLASFGEQVVHYLQENGAVGTSDSEAMEEAAQLYLNAISSDDVEARTTQATLVYTLEGKTWVLQNRSVVADAVFGSAFGDINAGSVAVDTGVGAASEN